MDRTSELYNADASTLTTKDRLLKNMICQGFFEMDAQQVFDKFLQEFEMAKDVTWNRPSEEYPDQFHLILAYSIRPYAYEWLNENKPLAWFKEMFK